jgi:hypothetical protein
MRRVEKHTDVILFDMAQLSFGHVTSGTETLLRVELANVGVLAEILLPEGTSRREGIFQALDGMLATLEVPASRGRWRKVALYNPLTSQVAFGPVPETLVYTDGRALEVPAYGLRGVVEAGVLRVEGRELVRLKADARSTSIALAAHA